MGVPSGFVPVPSNSIILFVRLVSTAFTSALVAKSASSA